MRFLQAEFMSQDRTYTILPENIEQRCDQTFSCSLLHLKKREMPANLLISLTRNFHSYANSIKPEAINLIQVDRFFFINCI